MDEKSLRKIEKNLDAIAKKHTLSAKISIDEVEVLEAEIKKGTIYIDSKNTLKLLTNPALIKIGLALRGATGGKYKVRMRPGFIKRILGGE